MVEPQRLTVVLPTYNEAANLPRMVEALLALDLPATRLAILVVDGADLVLQMDCDFSHPPRFVPVLLAALPGADMVLGSRFAPGGKVDEHWAWYRKLLSWFANSVYV